MAHYYPELAARVARQAEELPELYGDFDFEATPERFTTDPDDRFGATESPG